MLTYARYFSIKAGFDVYQWGSILVSVISTYISFLYPFSTLPKTSRSQIILFFLVDKKKDATGLKTNMSTVAIIAAMQVT